MAVYVLAATYKKDEDLYAQYEQLAGQSAMEFGIEPVAIDDHPIVLEGQAPGQRIIMLKFPDEETMRAWYDSETYRKARGIRATAAETSFLLAVNSLQD